LRVFNYYNSTDFIIGDYYLKSNPYSYINNSNLIDNSIANTLHRHSELVASDGSPDPALSVDASGNVGIGDTGPDALFEVSASGGASNLFMLSSDDGNDGDLVTVLNNGNIGIGTTEPDSILVIHKNIDNNGACLGLTNLRINDDSATILRFTNYRTGGEYGVSGIARGGIAYEYLNNGGDRIRRMTISEHLGTTNTLVLNNGNIGIGTTGPTRKLDILGSASDTAGSGMIGLNTGSGAKWNFRVNGWGC